MAALLGWREVLRRRRTLPAAAEPHDANLALVWPPLIEEDQTVPGDHDPPDSLGQQGDGGVHATHPRVQLWMLGSASDGFYDGEVHACRRVWTAMPGQPVEQRLEITLRQGAPADLRHLEGI